jgi:beta-exotoxin I transport system ATP-binding protein
LAPAIETQHLSKHYGRVRALEDLSLRVDEGDVFGFLGPNGAGKTTTIRVLLGLIRAGGGSARVLGREVRRGAVWRREIGYLPGELTFWPALSGARTLAFLEQLTGRPAVWRDELLDRLQLAADDLARRVGTYSDGMKQKLGIVQALQCAPRLVLLDEPTKGLDPLVQQAFYDLLRELPRRGTTIFFSSHVLPEVERVCTRAAMLRAGRLVSSGDLDHLRGALPRRAVVVFSADVDQAALSECGRVVTATPRRIELLVPTDRVAMFVKRLGSLPVADVQIEAPSLEEVFLEQYR